MMKKLLILLVCLVMAFPAMAEEPDRAALTEEWGRLLRYYETVQHMQTWALDYAERFLASGAWEDLLMARMAASSAYTCLLSVEAPAAALPEAQYALWMQKGHDLTYVPMMFTTLPQDLNVAVQAMVYLLEGLEYSVLWQPRYEALSGWVTLRQDMLALNTAMTCNMTNGLTLSAQEASRAAEQAAFAAACPHLFAGYEWLEDEPALLDLYAAMLDRQEEQISAQVRIIGEEEMYASLLISQIEQGDFAAIARNAAKISGLPTVLPEPLWNDPQLEYVWIDEDGEIYCAAPGEALENVPVSIRRIWYDVSLGAFNDYVQQLLDTGCAMIMDDAETTRRTVYLQAYDSQLALLWSEGAAVMLAFAPAVCIAPAWYTN